MKKFLAGAIAAALVAGSLCLTGCQSGGKNTIKVTSYLWDKPEEKQYITEELIPKFEEETGIQVEFEIVATTDMDKYIQGQKDSGKWATDVLISNNGSAAAYIDSGFVQPINDVSVDGITLMEAFDGDLVVDGDRYFYPIAADVYLTLANKEALPYLPEGASIDNLTWEQYIQWSKNIAEANGPKTVMPAQAGKNLMYQIGAMELSYGSEFFPVMNDEGAVKAWSMVQELQPTLISTCSSYPDPVQAMQSGEAWLTFFHMSPVSSVYNTAPEQYVVGPAPSGDAGTGTIAGASVIGITAGSEHKEEAAQFIEFMMRPENLYNVNTKAGSFIAPVEEVLDQLSDSAADQIMKMGISTLQTAKTSGTNGGLYTDFGSVKTVFESTFNDIMNGVSVDQSYLDAKQAELDALKK